MTARSQASGMKDIDNGGWKRLCPADQPNDDLGIRVELDDGHAVTAFRVDDEYFVIDDLCTHGSASLSDGFVEGSIIECPFHGGKFDMRTGEPTAFPCTVPLKVYPSKVENGALHALISGASADVNAQEDKEGGADR